MKAYQVVLTVLVVVALNNFVLYLLFAPSFGNLDAQPEAVSPASAAPPREEQRLPLVEPQAVVSADSEPSSEPSALYDEQRAVIADAVEKFHMSDNFTDIMDEYQLSVTERYKELEKRFRQASAYELYTVVMESEKSIERQAALQFLIQGKLNDLDVLELRNLYDEETIDWYQSMFLMRLIERGDADGLELAKQKIQAGSWVSSGSSELLSAVYDIDPEFIKGYIDQVRLDELSSQNLYGLLVEPELAAIFFENNFDEILKSNNQSVFSLGSYAQDIELNDQRESAIVELFSASNRDKRMFALGLVRKFKNLDRLRRSYSTLSRTKDKKTFLTQLLSGAPGSKHHNLASELISSSDDAEIRGLIKGL